MVPAGNKGKRLSSVNHATKTVHHQFIIIINNVFVNHLKKLNIKLILSDIIEKKHLSYGGFHLRMSGVIKDSCHVSTTESIGNHCEFVSKIDLLPDLNVVNSEANSTVEMVLMNSLNTYRISGLKLLEVS